MSSVSLLIHLESGGEKKNIWRPTKSIDIPECIFALLIFITKWNFYLRTITSTIAKSPREWLRIKSGNICTALQRFQYLAFQSFRVDVFKDDSSGRQLDYTASYFFPLNR